MAGNFVTITKRDLARGIDAYSARSAVQEGFLESLVNMDTSPTGKISSRTGYEGYYGWVPLRVSKLVHSGTAVRFFFDNATNLDLSTVDLGPIIAYGRSGGDSGTPAPAGDFGNTNASQYYTTFSINNKVALSGTGTAPGAAADLGLTDAEHWFGLARSDLDSKTNNTILWPDDAAISTSTYDINIDYTVATPTDAFIYTRDVTATAGSIFKKTVTANTTFTIAASEHQLDTFNILYKCYDTDVSAGEKTEVVPDSVTVDTAGEVIFTFDSSFAGDLYLEAAPSSRSTATTSSVGSNSLSISSPGSSWNFVQAYIYDSGNSRFDSIILDNISYDADTDAMTVEFTSAASESVEIYWTNATVASNSIEVTDNSATSETYTDESPQLTLWGIDHSGIYKDSTSRGGHVNHLDTYTKDGSTEVICGLGGNLFYDFSRTSSNATTYDFGTGLVDIQERVEGDQALAPLFRKSSAQFDFSDVDISLANDTITEADHELVTGDTVVLSTSGTIPTGLSTSAVYYIIKVDDDTFKLASSSDNATSGIATSITAVAGSDTHTLYVTSEDWAYRTRGQIFDSTIRDNGAVVTTVAYDGGTPKYTLSLTDPSAALAFSTQVNANDQLTVTGCPEARWNGTFPITAIAGTSTAPIISVTNSAITSDRYDDAGLQARAGVFTGRITCEAQAPLLPGDILASDFGTGAPTMTVLATDGMDTYVSGVTSGASAPDGLLLYGQRNTSLVPIRNSSGISTIENFVSGDMLTVSSLARKVRILYAYPGNAGADISIDVAGDGTTLTVTTASAHSLNIGQKVLLGLETVSGINGEYTVLSTPTLTTFTVSSSYSATTSSAGYLIANVLELDESFVVSDGGDSASFTVVGRWFPIEAPQDSTQDLVDLYEQSYFGSSDYDQQTPLSSVTINNSMYLTNGVDPVMKYDGTSLYRAGLPRWQASAFTARDDAAAAEISVAAQVTVNSVDTASGLIEIDAPLAPVGSWIQEDGESDGPWLVEDAYTEEDGGGTNNYFIQVRKEDKALTNLAATDTLNVASLYKYYVRLNYIDSNDNIIVSAPVQSEDMTIRLMNDARVELRFIGLPNYGRYDFSSIELELYRTDGSGSGGFYFHNRQLISFDNDAGYISIYDSLDDSFIVSPGNKDRTSRALLGAELGTTWDEPPRAKTLTTLSDRLVLGNIKSWPYVDIDITRPDSGDSVANSDLDGYYFLFRKDEADTSTGTSMSDYVSYEFVETTNGTAITPASITGAGTTVTIPTGSPPQVGDWVYLYHSTVDTNNALTFSGWFQVSSRVPSTSFSFEMAGARNGTIDDVDLWISSIAGVNIPVALGTDGNYLDIDASAAGSAERNAAIRLAKAINATMRMTDVSQETNFEPWLKAEAGNDWPVGRLRVSSPRYLATTPEVVANFFSTDYQIWINNYKVAPDDEVSFIEKKLPSRVVRSYRNYPELFDNAYDPSPYEGDSAVDVNSADGQEITAMVPFFGESATGSDTPLNQELVVFKTGSVYVVNIETRIIKKIDSRGQGCTAPRSVAVTQDGIFFANESGIYRLGRDLKVRRVGSFLERRWDSINTEKVGECAGHHYNGGRRYKLSYPSSSASYSDRAYVYDYEREGKGQEFGAWAEYDNHGVVWWANDKEKAYWSSQSGDVFLVRNRGEAQDHRDEDQAITSTAILRAEDFGLPGLRKMVAGITTFFELEKTDLTSVAISTDMSMQGSFESAGDISVDRDLLTHQTVRASLATRRGTHCQVRYVHATKDEQMVISGVAYEVGQLSSRLVKDTGDI